MEPRLYLEFLQLTPLVLYGGFQLAVFHFGLCFLQPLVQSIVQQIKVVPGLQGAVQPVVCFLQSYLEIPCKKREKNCQAYATWNVRSTKTCIFLSTRGFSPFLTPKRQWKVGVSNTRVIWKSLCPTGPWRNSASFDVHFPQKLQCPVFTIRQVLQTASNNFTHLPQSCWRDSSSVLTIFWPFGAVCGSVWSARFTTALIFSSPSGLLDSSSYNMQNWCDASTFVLICV